MIKQEYQLLDAVITLNEHLRTSKQQDRIITLGYGSNADYLGAIKEFADNHLDKVCGFFGDDTDAEIMTKNQAKVVILDSLSPIEVDYVFVTEGCVYKLDCIAKAIPYCTIVALG